MKNLFFFLFLLTAFETFSQVWVEPFQNLKVSFTDRVDINNLDEHQVFLSTGYSRSNIANPEILLRRVGDGYITTIDLVYTDFQRAEHFDQRGLNARRARQLYQLFPEIFEDARVQFSLIAQDGCSDEVSCGELPHGFIVTFRPAQDQEPLSDEIDVIGCMTGMSRLAVHWELTATDGAVVPYLFDHNARFPEGETEFAKYIGESTNYPSLALDKRSGTELFLDFTIGRGGQLVDLKIDGNDEFGFISALEKSLHDMPLWEAAERKGEKINSRKKALVRFSCNNGEPEVLLSIHSPGDPVLAADDFMDEYRVLLTDTVVATVFERNRWQKSAVVMDVTGSMSPYSAQLLIWLGLNDRQDNHYVVFNDGDGKADSRKEMGLTGGVYMCEDQSRESLFKIISEAMYNGGGGDLMENDVEALLRANEHFPDAEKLILVADNWNAPRDLELAKQLNKPVHVVLCGAQRGISPEYLDLARKTGGGVHVIEQDIVELAQMREGETIVINGLSYKIKNGKFTPITNP